jgi:CrcB protein
VLRFLLVGVGGLAGSIARYALAGWVQRLGGSGFPLGTLAVNLTGSFLVGLVITLSLDRGLLGGNARLLLAVGFCGGFTTMSTFAYETMVLVADGDVTASLGNLAASVGGSLAAVWLGVVAGRIL